MTVQEKKQKQIQSFDPNGVGIENGNFIGLPFDENTADVIIYPVPCDITVSYGAGTSLSFQNILQASYQLDLYLEHAPLAWKKGIYFLTPPHQKIVHNEIWRKKAEKYIQFLESGKTLNEENNFSEILDKINQNCAFIHQQVEEETTEWIQKGKKIALLGGDHSTPLGYLKTLAKQHSSFGILQFDAHCDLRKSYEGFTYSHASIFYNVLEQIPQIERLTQIGIRDFCEEEFHFAQADERVHFFSDTQIQNALFQGESFHSISQKIINTLPKKVYVSFDIDALEPSLCPNTGTPVPSGFSFSQVTYILQQLKASGKEVIGVDLCEVAGSGEWDGNVGARILYHLIALL